MTGSAAFPAASVDDPTNRLEEVRHTLDFVEHDEPIRVPLAVRIDIGEAGAVGRALQIDVGGGALFGDLEGERRLAHLAGSGQHDRRSPRQQVLHSLPALSWDESRHNRYDLTLDVRFVRLCGSNAAPSAGRISGS